jgi:glycosyltransferase involved in cell wall biosynthesis
MLLQYRAEPFVSISDAERAFRPELNYVGTVYNGINTAAFPFKSSKDDYLAFAGRIAPEKGPDLAIEVARRTGRPLFAFGPVDTIHQDYFDTRIRPHIAAGHIEYLGTLDQKEVNDVLGNASALLMPLRWDEPFGLIVAEAMAMGTPVIAWNRGAMPELIRDGETGFLVDSVEAGASAVNNLGQIDSADCRERVLRLFDRRVMATGYTDVYASLLAEP